MVAPVDVVFAHLVALQGWPEWQLEVDRTEAADELVVGSLFQVVTRPGVLDGIVGELVPPTRFGWAGVGEAVSFYQSWLLLDDADGGTLAVFQEAARGPEALLRAAARQVATRRLVDALPPG
jgi:hypothetical protein